MKDEINPFTLPSLPLSWKKAFPACAAVYFVIKEGQIVYVGKAINLQNRWAVHHLIWPNSGLWQGHEQAMQKVHKWKWLSRVPIVTEIRIAWLECKVEALEALEAVWLHRLKPPLNRRKPTTQQIADGDRIEFECRGG